MAKPKAPAPHRYFRFACPPASPYDLHMVNWRDFIEQNPEILAGKPVIKGTRLSVELIMGLIAAGWTHQEMFENYPALRGEHIQAAAAFVRDRLAEEKVFALSA